MALAELLNEVEEAHNRAGRRLIGLSEDQLSRLEEIAGKLPTCLRQVLSRVGVMTNPFRMHHRFSDWACEIPHRYVCFAWDSAPDYVAIRSDDDDGREVVVFSSETGRRRRTKQSFEGWLRERWREASPFSLSEPRSWAVEISLRGDPESNASLLARILEGEIDGWVDTGGNSRARILTAGVRNFRINCILGGASIALSDDERQIENGLIARVLEALQSARVDFTVVDYGLLPTDTDGLLDRTVLEREGEEARQRQRSADRAFFDSLGDESMTERCHANDCERGRIAFGLFCRVHHYEMVRGERCPFDGPTRAS